MTHARLQQCQIQLQIRFEVGHYEDSFVRMHSDRVRHSSLESSSCTILFKKHLMEFIHLCPDRQVKLPIKQTRKRFTYIVVSVHEEYIQCMVYVLILMDSDNVIPVRLYKLCVCFVIMYFEI